MIITYINHCPGCIAMLLLLLLLSIDLQTVCFRRGQRERLLWLREARGKSCVLLWLRERTGQLPGFK